MPSSPELRCVNMMCEKVGAGCACRLALSIGRMAALEHVDISGNALPVLPDSLFSLARLRVLRAADNQLAQVRAEDVARLTSLEELDLRGNALKALPLAALDRLPQLRRVLVAGNPGAQPAGAGYPELSGSRLVARGVLLLT